ncbi:MAG: hypothetical protein ASARMPREDX12_007974 [Alectoria sarmentosa]|nr:MAG: hypothetical protein ASARMPREDX12_007974 [Alectoria sarmentosa]
MDPNNQPHYPNPDSTLPFWRTQPHELDNYRSSKNLPTDCDVLIIGAGYAGAATAYHLYDEDPSPPSIVLLEARQACSGATARNGGHLRPEVYFGMSDYIEKHGMEAAAEISNHEVAHIQAIKRLVEKEQIDCDFTLTRTFDVFLDEAFANKSKGAYDSMVKRGLTSIQDAHFTPAKYAKRVSGVKAAKGCFSFTAAHLWPYKLIMHLLGLAITKGLNLQTHTPVTHVSSTADADGRSTVTTPRGIIKAKKIVFASNGFTAGLLPEYSQKIVPCRGLCCRIVTPDPTKAPYLNNTYTLRAGPGLYDYLIPHVDGSIIVGGAKSAMSKDNSVWYDNSDDSTLIEPAKEYFDEYMQRRFVGWEDSGAYVDQVWTGIMGYTADLQPHVGPIPNRPNQYVLAGFNGHGMPVIFLAAKGVAEMIRHGKTFEQTGLPRVYRTTEERLGSDENLIFRKAQPDAR